MVIKYVHKLGNENKELMEYQSQDIPDNILGILTMNPKFSESVSLVRRA